MRKKILLSIAIVTMLSLAACGTETNANTKETITEEKTTISNSEAMSMAASEHRSKVADAQQNTSGKVDQIAYKAKDDANEADDKLVNEAVNYIKEHYPDFYSSNEIMEQTMYYGYLLEYKFKEDSSKRIYAELGMDTYQAVKYVYRNAEKIEDQHTQENLKQIKKHLDEIK